MIFKDQNKPSFGWKSQLKKIIVENNKNHGSRNKVVSIDTQADREEILFMAFSQLRQLGFKIENPQNFQERHFKVLLRHWLDSGLSASTIQKRSSVMRVFSKWIGKDNMLKTLEDYVEPDEKYRLQRSQVNEVDKSWVTNNVSSDEIIKQAEMEDVKLAAQLKMIEAFGLRRKEAVCFRPKRAIALGDGKGILVDQGTKGKRPRLLMIENDQQHEALNYALNLVKTMDEHIGWDDLTLKQSLRRFNYKMEKFGITKKGLGVTAHGLRHEVFNDKLEEITGVPSPVRGGNIEDVNPDLLKEAQHIVTNMAGHSRLGITKAYFGKYEKKKKSSEN